MAVSVFFLTHKIRPVAVLSLFPVGLASCGGGGESAPVEHQTADQPDLFSNEYQVHVIYAIPRDQPDERFDINGEIAASLEASNRHFEKLSGAKYIRYDLAASGAHDISFLQLPDRDADYANQGRGIRAAIQEDLLAAGFSDSKKIYLVYYGGSSNEMACGLGPPIRSGDPVAILILKGAICRNRPFVSSNWPPNDWAKTASHEIVHALGFVDPCSPDHDPGSPGHVFDKADLMYAGFDKLEPTRLDAGQDDYYGANVSAGCERNLFFSAFLEPRDGDQLPLNFHH